MKAGALRAHFASLVILLCEVMNGVLVCCASHCVDVGLLLPYLLCHLFTAVCLRSKALKERNTRFCSLSQHVLPQRLCVAHNRHRVLGRSLVEMCLWTLVFASSFLSTVNKSVCFRVLHGAAVSAGIWAFIADSCAAVFTEEHPREQGNHLCCKCFYI